MKKLTAFFLAVILAALSGVGIHLFCRERAARDPHGFAVWSNEKKFSSWEGLKENLDENVIPVFGSSEIQHGTDTEFHPNQVFADTEFQPLLIGAGYYQSLGHAITLASLGDSVKSKKAVLLLAPQWFRGHGVKAEAFASRFSEIQFIHMLENPRISPETRQYLIQRTEELLKKDPQTLERIRLYTAGEEETGPWEKLCAGLYRAFLKEKDLCQTVLAEEMDGIPLASGKTSGKSSGTAAEQTDREVSGEQAGALPEGNTEPDWSALERKAQEQGEKSEQNPFYMEPAAWEKKKRLIEKGKVKRDQVTDGYKSLEERGDLEAFLDVCREMEIEPLVVMLPVNGYWYDYTGYGMEAREKYYQRIRALLEERQVEYADLSGEEYTKYFFEDGIHPSGKGWTKINEILYRFYQEG